MAQHLPTYRRMIAKLLKVYRNEPCLWDSTNKFYHNKKMRLTALDKMLAVVRTLEPDSERCDVMKKITCLRTTYRKERKKVEASLKGDEEVHKPTLWYYNLLTFLDDPINDEEPQCEYLDNVELEEEVSFVNANDYTCKQEYFETESHDSLLIPSTSTRHSSETNHKFATKRQFDETAMSNNINLLNEYSKRPKVETEDRHDVFCKSLAMKLRHLENRQRIMAEKLINDVMFEAEMGNLNTDFRIVQVGSTL